MVFEGSLRQSNPGFEWRPDHPLSSNSASYRTLSLRRGRLRCSQRVPILSVNGRVVNSATSNLQQIFKNIRPGRRPMGHFAR
jgi:hypothetical protein